MSVREGDILEGIEELNGWLWSENKKTHEMGWIPVKNIKLLEK
ncbi:SH3 domain-containing protein [Dysgonomonas reticulitermitis]